MKKYTLRLPKEQNKTIISYIEEIESNFPDVQEINLQDNGYILIFTFKTIL